MRVIAEASLQMSERTGDGLHYVKDRYCKDSELPCFAFDSNGLLKIGCDRFKKLPTGVKICLDK
ncbi:MAG: hypothetical protein WC455_19505 [Dehalococcoidia bacterium]|jgi:hypothetical protein